MENSIRETNIDRIRTRPRFTIETDIAPKVYEQILREHLKSDASIAGNINAEVAEFFVKTAQPSYYNPKLTMRIESAEDRTIIRGIFGPSAAVWTFFMFLYFAFTVLWMVFITTEKSKTADGLAPQFRIKIGGKNLITSSASCLQFRFPAWF
ncbi:hypothetical protein IMZ16_00195 [Cruoricaptor ignavus]|uniref:Uncharacterized protein n=1 Tax=Cruoricaptor ignavus TaxID=1118202 RepID=A0A7M1T260_9FLAO|nr:hypothetical protein [Cruoricaptor ignavus]QOR73905.1 hypothetical protein IMZ16_00195 [Cruoricaptor ignavus]